MDIKAFIIFYKDLHTNSIMPIINYDRKKNGLNVDSWRESNRKIDEESLFDFFRNKKYFNFEKCSRDYFFFRLDDKYKIRVDYLKFNDLSISCFEIKDVFDITENIFGVNSHYLTLHGESYLVEKIFICGNIGITRFEKKGSLWGFTNQKYIFNNYLYAFYEERKYGPDNWKYKVYLRHTLTNTEISDSFIKIHIEWINQNIMRINTYNEESCKDFIYYVDKLEGLLFKIVHIEKDINLSNWENLEIIKDNTTISLKNGSKELCKIYAKQNIQIFQNILYVNNKFSFSLQYLLQPIIDKREPIEKFGLLYER
jgi:hypothetical protein